MIKKCLNIFLLILAFMLFEQSVYSQKTFNIKADYVLFDDNELIFIKKDTLDFNCIDFYYYNDHLEADTFIMTEKEFSEEKSNVTSVSDLRRMKPKKFFKILNKYEFYINYNSKQKIIFKTKQEIFKEEIYSINKTEVDYFHYEYLFYINNKIPLLLLYKENERFENTFFITLSKIKLQVYSYNGFDSEKFRVRKHKKKNETKILECLPAYYKIKQKNNLYFLVSKFTNKKIINTGFDSLKIINSFIFANKNGKKYIYSCNLNKIKLKNVTTFHYFNEPTLNSIQIIQNNQIYWIDKSGNKSVNPKLLVMSICGNETAYIKNISKTENTYFFIEKYYNEREKLESVDSSQFIIPSNYTEIRFCNNNLINYYYNNDKNINDILFIFKNINNKYSLVKVKKQKGKIMIKDILLKDVDKIEYKKQNIKFYINGLYGYFPQNKEAKYKSLENFNYYYARFEYPDGKKGWLDKKGNEYFGK